MNSIHSHLLFRNLVSMRNMYGLIRFKASPVKRFNPKQSTMAPGRPFFDGPGVRPTLSAKADISIKKVVGSYRQRQGVFSIYDNKLSFIRGENTVVFSKGDGTGVVIEASGGFHPLFCRHLTSDKQFHLPAFANLLVSITVQALLKEIYCVLIAAIGTWLQSDLLFLQELLKNLFYCFHFVIKDSKRLCDMY